LSLVRWQGEYKGVEAVWLRWATFAGDLLPTESERAQQERMRAQQERMRAQQERMRAQQERMRAQQERMRAEDLEALLQRYRERFGDLPE
jgi:uncharacterized protein (DUF3084 family)